MRHFDVEHIDFTENLIRKWDAKKHEYRWVGISPWLAQMLKTYIDTFRIKKGLLFPITSKRCDQILKFWCKIIGVNGWVSWHLLRRTYVNQAAQIGIDLIEVQHVTGDSTSSLLRYYRRASPADAGKRMEALYDPSIAQPPKGMFYRPQHYFPKPGDKNKNWREPVKTEYPPTEEELAEERNRFISQGKKISKLYK